MTSIRRARAVALVAAAGLLATACAGSSDSSADDSEAAGAPISAESEAAAAPTAPDPTGAPGTTGSESAESGTADVPEILQFTSPLVGGGEFNAASVAGQPTAFWFWAPT